MNASDQRSTVNPIGRDLLDLLIDEHNQVEIPRQQRLWSYYRNDMEDNSLPGRSGRRYRLAQEQGLPDRLLVHGQHEGNSTQRERVIENDIAWRVHTLVDFMFGKPVALQSCAPDPQRAVKLEMFLRRVFELAGGVSFFQDLALLGSVYGFVDVVLRVDPVRSPLGDADPFQHAHRFVLESVEAPRAVPILNPSDYRRLDAYVLHYRQTLNQVEQDGFLRRVRNRMFGNGRSGARRASCVCTEVWTDASFASYRAAAASELDRSLVEQSANRLGRIPVVHIQNLPQPFFYEGLSEVEPLIPLQDELNTRLSDRANRVTFQSFKMYLGKGIEKFTEHPVGPGQMWATDNPDASIEEFGGDSESPSEDAHINEIREAMDKTSGVTAVAAGLLRNKVGNLTSENALRIVMMGLVSRTEKKRISYGAGIERLCELILHAADVTGVLPNHPSERRIRLDWPNPLPDDPTQRLRDAQLKLEIGVPRKQVLTELGYGDCAEHE